MPSDLHSLWAMMCSIAYDDGYGDLTQLWKLVLKYCVHPEGMCMLQLAQAIIGQCRLLHPIMPFVTEELWQKLPKHPSHESRESIMICSYPAAQSAWNNAEVEADMAYVNAIVARTRRLRSGEPASQRLLPRL